MPWPGSGRKSHCKNRSLTQRSIGSGPAVSGAHDSDLLDLLVLHGASGLLTSPTERRRERECVLCSP